MISLIEISDGVKKKIPLIGKEKINYFLMRKDYDGLLKMFNAKSNTIIATVDGDDGLMLINDKKKVEYVGGMNSDDIKTYFDNNNVKYVLSLFGLSDYFQGDLKDGLYNAKDWLEWNSGL